MTPNKNHCIPSQFVFEQVKSRPVIVNFKGEPVTSDAGLTLIAELDRRRKITSRLGACFKDYREQNKILHPVHSLAKTEFKNATVETIRTKILKLGAIINISKRRIVIAISAACPYKEIFATIYKRLSQLPCPS